MGAKDLSAEALAAAYRSGVSAYRLAKDNKCSIWAVISRLRQAGVEMRPDGVPKQLELTQEQRTTFDSLNAGLLLGDASINGNALTRSNHCFLRVEQSNMRLGWLQQVASMYTQLGVHVNTIPIKPKQKPPQIDGRTICQGPSSLLYTGVSDEFRELRRSWYPNDGPKCVPRNLQLDALTIAMWLCGDGSSNGAVNGLMFFHTNGFNQDEVQLLSELLTDHGVLSTVKRHHRPGQFLVKVTDRGSVQRLYTLVLPYMPACCLYKFKHMREPRKSSAPVNARSLTPEQVRLARRLKSEGFSYAAIAKKLHVSVSCVVSLVHGRTYKDVWRRPALAG